MRPHVYRRVLGLYRAEFRYLIALAALVFVPVGLAKAVAVVPLWLLTELVDTGLSEIAVELLGDGVPAEWAATTTALIVTSPFFALTVADLTVELAE